MQKTDIDVFARATDILTELRRGVLVTTRVGDKVNAMTISWGMLGIEWGMPIFITYIRGSRFTHELLAQNPRFTVNIPHGDCDRRILSLCGTRSGRDLDKLAELGLTPVYADAADPCAVPAIAELPLTLECRVVYSRLQDAAALPAAAKEKFYPADGAAGPDLHTVFYGAIERAYLLHDD